MTQINLVTDDNPALTDIAADEDFFDSAMQEALKSPRAEAVAKIATEMTIQEGIERLRPIAKYNPYAAELLKALEERGVAIA